MRRSGPATGTNMVGRQHILVNLLMVIGRVCTMRKISKKTMIRNKDWPNPLFSIKSALFAIAIIFLIAVTLFSGIGAATLSQTSTSPDGSVKLTITQPMDEDEGWIDIAPPKAIVLGEASAPADIRNITIRNGADEVICGNEPTFACDIPVFEGENTIIVTVTDNLGHQAVKALNLTVHLSIPPPTQLLAVTVSGRVTDLRGNPVPGALVKFESEPFASYPPYKVTSVTAADGSYMIKKARGLHQTISVEKEGYLPTRTIIVFERTRDELDLELVPSIPSIPGFGIPVCIAAFLGAIFLGWFCRK
jgi:hypothetical protein